MHKYDSVYLFTIEITMAYAYANDMLLEINIDLSLYQGRTISFNLLPRT